MRKRKNGFWTFVFSFIPGCAEMYMGFMKMGLSLMVAFFGLWALAAWLGSDIMVFVAIVAWFYSFFHARNMASMSDAELQQTEDVYLYHIPQDFKGPNFSEKSRKWIAILLIIFGVILLYRNVIYFLEDVFEIIPYVAPLRICADSAEPAWDSLSPSLCPSPTHSLSQSK